MSDKVRRTLLCLGYNEAISSTFIAKADSRTFCNEEPVAIANPLSEEAIGRNQVADRGVTGTQLFLHQALAEDVSEASATKPLGKHESGQADLGGFPPDRPGRNRVSLVDLTRDRSDLAFGKLSRHADDGLLFLRQRHQLGGQLAQHSVLLRLGASTGGGPGSPRSPRSPCPPHHGGLN